MKNKILIKLLAAFGVVMLLFSAVLGSVFLALFRDHAVKINRMAMEQQAVSIADTLSSFQRGSMGGYGAYLRFLDKLALADVWIVAGNLDLNLYPWAVLKENRLHKKPRAGLIPRGCDVLWLRFWPCRSVWTY